MPYRLYLCFCLLLSGRLVSAQEPTWPQIQLTPLIGGVSNPTFVTHAGDGTGRIFVVEQSGRIRIFQNGALIEQPFLDIRDRVADAGEQGLLSVAFPPNFAQTQHFYVYYTSRPELGDIAISRFFVTADPNVADPESEQRILTIPHQEFKNHNGGQLAFGPADGYLYLGTGDGGAGGDPFLYAQDKHVLLGKLIRIDVEAGVDPYAIPPTNPFRGDPEARPELWAIGLRNPWRFSFDPATNDLYVGDVGQNLYEEVDFQPSTSNGGEDYGWSTMEGFHCYRPEEGCDQTGLILPVSEYDHSRGDCSIIGGYVYRGADYPTMQGIYFFGDFCTGRIWGLQFDGAQWRSALLREGERDLNIGSFGTDEAGNLLVANNTLGQIYIVTERAP